VSKVIQENKLPLCWNPRSSSLCE